MGRLVVLLAVALLVLVACDPPPLASPGSGGSDVADIVDPSVVGTPQGSFVSEDWHYVGETDEPAFENSWTNQAGNASLAFRLREAGIVDVVGKVSHSGASGASVFVLPEGYRPLVAAVPMIGIGKTGSGTYTSALFSLGTDGTFGISAGTFTDLWISGSFFIDSPVAAP